MSMCVNLRELEDVVEASVLHAASVLPTYLEQGLGDLTQRTYTCRVHQLRKYILVVDCGLL
jgi:hypothetical protein